MNLTPTQSTTRAIGTELVDAELPGHFDTGRILARPCSGIFGCPVDHHRDHDDHGNSLGCARVADGHGSRRHGLWTGILDPERRR